MANIKLHHSLSRAQKVLKLANAIGFSKVAGRHFYAQAWDNCREQGLCLKALLVVEKKDSKSGTGLKTPAVFIAEARSSDSTVIVVDEDLGGHIQAMPTDEGWAKGRHFFHPGEEKKAAKFVVDVVNRMAAQSIEE